VLAASDPPSSSTGSRNRPAANAPPSSTPYATHSGRRSYRIAEEANERRPRIGCSSQDGGKKFFPRTAPAAPGDDPRSPFSCPSDPHFPNTCHADDSVLGSGDSVRGGKPFPAHWRGTSPALAPETSGGPLLDRQGRSSTVARSRAETDDRSLRTSTAATVAGRGDIEIPSEMKQAEGGPREVPLPKVKPRAEADYFDPRRLFFHTAARPLLTLPLP